MRLQGIKKSHTEETTPIHRRDSGENAPVCHD
jgi:hypothetical protein